MDWFTTTTTATVLRPFVRDYPSEPVPDETPTHPPSQSSSNLYQLLPSTMIHSILLVQVVCLASCTTSVHVLFGLPIGLKPSTSYSIHFFTQSVSSFRSICPYHYNLFCCCINIISFIPSLSVNSLLGTLSFTLTLHIHLTILISACWSVTSFSFLTGQDWFNQPLLSIWTKTSISRGYCLLYVVLTLSRIAQSSGLIS